MAKLAVIILVLTVVAVCTSEDADNKKRGVQKGSNLNSLNTHQKPDAVGLQRNYPQKTQDKESHYQRQTITVLQQNPQQEIAVQQNHQVDQQVYALQPQVVPIQFVPQPVYQHYQQPRYQILASRNPTGQMQLTLIPHNVFMNLVYGSSVYTTPSAQGPIQQQQEVAQTPPPPAEPAYNNYVTQSPLVYSQQSQVPAADSSYYSNQQVPVQYVYSNSAQAAQPPVYSQQVPAYSQNYITPSVTNSVYSSPYYQNSYQTKYQYSNNNAYEQNQNYETIPQTEYEKPNLAQPAHQIHKNDVSSHTNQYISPPDTHFRPIHVYHRGASHYRS